MTVGNITVFGAGTMGHGIAQRAAMAGFYVTLADVSEALLERGLSMMASSLDLMVSEGRLERRRADETLSRVAICTSSEAAAASADLVFEAVFEDLGLKRRLFGDLGRWTRPEVVLASNTSSFDISLLAEATERPERVVGAHWFHPPQITPAVEVIPTAFTSPEALATVLDVLARMGKYPTRCSNVPGFVANRIQFAMVAEAMRIIGEGVATAEEVDRIVKSSIGFRLSCFGPCEIADQAGVDVYKSIFESLREATGRDDFQTPPVIASLHAEGRYGLKTGAGFYDYGGGRAAEVLGRRDRLLLERLALFERDNMAPESRSGEHPAAGATAPAEAAAKAGPRARPGAAETEAAVVPPAGAAPDVYARALELHLRRRGKLECAPKTQVETMEDLALVYTPGVAEACREIVRRPDAVFEVTNKWNTVAVITDGSAVLGLGDIGPLASLPVMEGKSVLFKRFAGIDSFPLALETGDVDRFVETVALLTPYLGGVNLEDIAAPRCFEIERRLIERCPIPVFHDDQHGTAVIALAGVLNALRVVGKDLSKIRAAMTGAGAAGAAICDFLLAAGLGDVVVCDREGVVHKGRKDLNWAKKALAEKTNKSSITGTLADAVKGADLFLGLSGPGLLTPAMVASMAPRPIVFAMANPTPEIAPAEAIAAGAAVVATGRSDFPNQINNCLGFPGIFRGALDVRASVINEPMKLAAAGALAALVAPDELSETNIIPTVFDPRVVPAMAAAVAEAARRTGAARI